MKTHAWFAIYRNESGSYWEVRPETDEPPAGLVHCSLIAGTLSQVHGITLEKIRKTCGDVPITWGGTGLVLDYEVTLKPHEDHTATG